MTLRLCAFAREIQIQLAQSRKDAEILYGNVTHLLFSPKISDSFL
jgi:hypothetical protein